MNKDEMVKDMADTIDKLCCERFALSEGRCGSEMTCGQCQAKDLYEAGYRKVADDEIVLKQSEYVELKKDFEEWRAEYDHNCLLRLEVFELEKQLEKAKLELEIREDTWGIGYDDVVKNYTEQIRNIAKKETAREVLQKVRDILQGDYNTPLPLAQLYQENGIYYGGKI